MGGSSISVEGGQITLKSHGEILMKTPSWQRQGAATLTPDMPPLASIDNCNLRFRFVDDDNISYAHTKYTAYFADGSNSLGTTDKDGYTATFTSKTEEEVKVHLHI